MAECIRRSGGNNDFRYERNAELTRDATVGAGQEEEAWEGGGGSKERGIKTASPANGPAAED